MACTFWDETREPLKKADERSPFKNENPESKKEVTLSDLVHFQQQLGDSKSERQLTQRLVDMNEPSRVATAQALKGLNEAALAKDPTLPRLDIETAHDKFGHELLLNLSVSKQITAPVERFLLDQTPVGRWTDHYERDHWIFVSRQESHDPPEQARHTILDPTTNLPLLQNLAFSDGADWSLHFAPDGLTRTYNEGESSGWKIHDEYEAGRQKQTDGQLDFAVANEYAPEMVRYEYLKSPDGQTLVTKDLSTNTAVVTSASQKQTLVEYDSLMQVKGTLACDPADRSGPEIDPERWLELK